MAVVRMHDSGRKGGSGSSSTNRPIIIIVPGKSKNWSGSIY